MVMVIDKLLHDDVIYKNKSPQNFTKLESQLTPYRHLRPLASRAPNKTKASTMTIRLRIDRPAPLVAGCVFAALQAGAAHAAQPFLLPNSLVIFSTTYDNTQGAVALLAPGTPIGTPPAANTACAPNDYVQVWNNTSCDGNFGITSPIQLTAIEPHSGHVFQSITVPTGQVVTSFSSKSEGALNFTRDKNGPHLVLVGYADSGVGALDVSNADAVPGQDLSNPVTIAFGSTYAFRRTIVAVDAHGHFSFTPTINYGGDNGRAGLLGSNGLYYTVGNSNSGSSSSFTNPTIPNVTTTTGLEVVNPIDASSASVSIPNGNSAEFNPLIQYKFGTAKADKAGKDNNYRGITEFGGALFFTKGSGSNGMDTVYTVSPLPRVADAVNTASVTTPIIKPVSGFPTDSAKATGGNYTPFAVFFANANTMYVTDEGTGNATDQTTHAGLQKWTQMNGTWQLDYVLTNGLIGIVDSNLNGYDGQWPDVTTIGLRNLTGVVNDDGTVTLYATTATSSASGDNGADPNRIVQITDVLAATTAAAVTQETFTTLAGPTYGTVYRGVAYVNP
jgi:hypothetical protein